MSHTDFPPLDPALAQRLEAVRAQLTHADAPFTLLHGVDSTGAPTTRFAKAPRQLTQWLQAGRAHGEKVFVQHYANAPGQPLPALPQSWTYHDFYLATDTLAAWLQVHGITAGQRVALLAANSPQWLLAFSASVLAGGTVAPLNSMNAAADMAATLDELRPSLIACDCARWQALQSAGYVAQCPVLLLDAAADGATQRTGDGHHTHALDAVLAHAAPDDAPFVPADPAPEDAALIVYTSGASVRPKGAVFTHDAVCQALYNLEWLGAFAALTSPAVAQHMRQQVQAQQLTLKTLCCVPFFHVSGLYAQVLVTLRHGRTLTILPRWQPEQALELLARERVTTFTAAPSMVMQLMQTPQFQALDYPSILALGFGGSAVPQPLRMAVHARFPQALVGTGFGLTESGGAGAGASGDAYWARSAASGLVSPIMQLRALDETGRALPPGFAGELCLRGPTLMQAYFSVDGSRDAETAHALRHGWLHTGDWGMVDADGYCHVLDRIKDVINRHGEKIAASEVESILLAHPAVAEAAVVPLPDAVTLEQVAALVVLKPAGSWLEPIATPDSAALCAWARQHLPPHKLPQTLHISSAALPRNASGKVLKSAVKIALQALSQK